MCSRWIYLKAFSSKPIEIDIAYWLYKKTWGTFSFQNSHFHPLFAHDVILPKSSFCKVSGLYKNTNNFFELFEQLKSNSRLWTNCEMLWEWTDAERKQRATHCAGLFTNTWRYPLHVTFARRYNWHSKILLVDTSDATDNNTTQYVLKFTAGCEYSSSVHRDTLCIFHRIVS